MRDNSWETTATQDKLKCTNRDQLIEPDRDNRQHKLEHPVSRTTTKQKQHPTFYNNKGK